MPKTKYDVIREIAKEKSSGSGSYSAGTCIYCDGSMKTDSEMKIDIYDIHNSCYDPNNTSSRLMRLLKELKEDF